MSPGSDSRPGLDELHDALLPQALDVHGAARGEVHDALHALGRAVDVGAEGVALTGQAHEGAAAARARRGEVPRARPLACGPTGRDPTTSGMTSPALRTTTVSPGRTSLSRTWSSLCSVASPTVDPPTNTGSSTAKGVARPVRPIDTMMRSSVVVRSSGGNLKAMAQRGAWEVDPSRRCSARSSTLTTTPSIS